MKYLTTIFLFVSISFSLKAQNIPRPNILAANGVQINSYTGNLFLARNDLFIPGLGLSLNANFSYNSQCRKEDWGYGYGWTFTYNMLYQENDSLDILVERPDGRRDTFEFDGAVYLSPIGIFDTLEEYQANQFLLSSKNGLKFFFDDPAHGKLTKIEDRNGNMITLTYSGSDLISATDASGRSLNFTWQNGHLKEILDNNGTSPRIFSYEYDNLGNLIKLINPLGDEIHYSYGLNHELVSIVDENGDELALGYQGEGVVSTMVTCFKTIDIRYLSEVNQTYVLENGDSGGQLTIYTFDDQGRLLNQKGNCCGFDTSLEYDSDNNLTKITDANGNIQSFTYDANGNNLSQTNALGQTISFSYEPNFNQIKSITNPKGFTTNFFYDANGNLIQVDKPLNAKELYTYDSQGNLQSYEDENNQVTTFSNNVHGYPESITYPLGTENITYDGLGNILTTTDANNNPFSITYDALDRPIANLSALGKSQTYGFDSRGNITSFTDENNHLQEYGYDNLGLLKSVSLPSGSTNYNFDEQGNLTKVTDANGHVNQYTYNSQNLLNSHQDGEGFEIHFNYDSNGNLLEKTDAEGNTIFYTYDQQNRLIQKTVTGSSESFQYDPNGNLTSMSNANITIEYTYDALDRITQKKYVEWNKIIQYTYDAANNRLTMTDPDGGLTQYTYDTMNRLISIENPDNEVTVFIYDIAGRLVERQNPNGTKTNYAYDNDDRLLSVQNLNSNNQTLFGFTYIYDDKGNRLSKQDQNGGIHTYNYDDSDRLISVIYPNGNTQHFTYDPVGNRIELLDNGNPTNYIYDNADRLIQAGNIYYSYDDNGNLQTKSDSNGQTIYHYDEENRLIQIQYPNGSTDSYTYDPLGNRLSKTTNGIQTQFLLDGVNRLMEFDNMGNTQARYTSGFNYDSWLSMKRGDSTYVYHQDALGTVVALTNDNEEVRTSYDYEVFGKIKNQTGTVENAFTYTGRELDAASGLYYYRSRFYDSSVGRFVSKDFFKGFLEAPPTLNNYNYVYNNPILFIDPAGYWGGLVTGLIRGVPEIFKGTLGDVSAFGFLHAVDEALKDVPDKQRVNEDLTALVKSLSEGGPISTNNYAYKPVYKGVNKPIKEGIKAVAGFIPSLLCLIPNFCETENPDPNSNNKNPEQDGNGTSPGTDGTGANGGAGGGSNSQGNQDGSQPSSGADQTCTIPVQSNDPNEILGPEGIGTQKWLPAETSLPYIVYYENDPDSATAAAQEVIIEIDLDPKFDPSTFQLGAFGFGNHFFDIPPGRNQYQARLDVTDSLNLFVDISAKIDLSNNRLSWKLESIDPITGLFTTNALAGFLPVNDSLGRGEGFITYSISPKKNVQTYDSLLAQANIFFDDNAPVATNIEVNVIDADAPQSAVNSNILAPDSTHLQIAWGGTDIGSGLRDYSVYVSINGGNYFAWQRDADSTLALLDAQIGNTYRLYSIARDSVHNLEQKQSFDVEITFTSSMVVPGLKICEHLELTFPAGNIPSDNYIVQDKILAEGTVESISNVLFEAGTSIDLLPGFEVEQGGVFEAIVKMCQLLSN